MLFLTYKKKKVYYVISQSCIGMIMTILRSLILTVHREFLVIRILVFIPYVPARVVTDRNSGYSKGFGFVHYATLEDAEKGIKGMDAQVCLT